MKKKLWIEKDGLIWFGLCTATEWYEDYKIVYCKSNDCYYMEMENDCYIRVWGGQIPTVLKTKTRLEWIKEHKKNMFEKENDIWKRLLPLWDFYTAGYSDEFIEKVLLANKNIIDCKKQERLLENEKMEMEIKQKKVEKQNNIIKVANEYIEAVKNKATYNIDDYEVLLYICGLYDIDIPLRTKWFLMNKVIHITTNWSYQYRSWQSKWSLKLSQIMNAIIKKINE